MVIGGAKLYTCAPMAKKLFRRFLPDSHQVRSHQSLGTLSRFLHEPDLWHLNRRSVAGGAAVGLFWAFVPMPFQMLPAAITALAARVNLPISLVGVWITNPLTAAPIYYFCYRVGAFVLGTGAEAPAFEASWTWLMAELVHIWQPLLLGCVITGATAAGLGYLAVRLVWRWHVVRDWEKRRRRVRPGPAHRPQA